MKNHFHGLLNKGNQILQIFVTENITKSREIPGHLIPAYYQEYKSFYGTWLMNKYIGGGVRSFRNNCWKRLKPSSAPLLDPVGTVLGPSWNRCSNHLTPFLEPFGNRCWDHSGTVLGTIWNRPWN